MCAEMSCVLYVYAINVLLCWSDLSIKRALPVKKSRTNAGGTVPTAVRLPSASIDFLRLFTGGITDGIKEAIDHLQFDEQFDKETHEFASNIKILAKEIQRQTGVDWHRAPAAHEAFSEAVRTWLEIHKPEVGSQADQPEPGISGPDDPKTLGRTIARTLNNNPPDQLTRMRNENLKRIEVVRRIKESDS
jgi:hypothetical protein